MKENSNKAIHLSWLVFILILSIIGIVSYRASDNLEILNFISFAATLSSIILSIIAIVYTFVTSNSSNSINENLISISNKLVNQTDDLNIIYKQIAEITGSIPEKVNALNKSVDETGKILSLSIDNAQKQKNGIIASTESLNANTTIVMSFLYYIFKIIHDTQKVLDLRTISEIITANYRKQDGNHEYLHGALKCLRSTGIIYFESTGTVFYNFDFYGNKSILFTREKVMENVNAKVKGYPEERIDQWLRQVSALLDLIDDSFI